MNAFTHNLQFLESATNLRHAIERQFDWQPNAEKAREIATCLRQGRLFYEAAKKAPLEIRPLQQHYGMAAFAKAIVLSQDRRKRLDSLDQTHGIGDCSAPNAKLADLRVVVANRGTFQHFNDAVAQLNRVNYFESNSTPGTRLVPTANSDELVNLNVTLRELLARAPGLERLYHATFGEDANVAPCILSSQSVRSEWTIRVDDREAMRDLHHLESIIARWRARYPFLERWTVTDGRNNYGYAMIHFSALAREAPEAKLEADEHGGYRRRERLEPVEDMWSLLCPLYGGYTNAQPSMASPIGQLYLSEYSIHYLALYLLSSLVRYRPQIWLHSLSGGSHEARPADDSCVALIEMFLSVNQGAVPAFVEQLFLER